MGLMFHTDGTEFHVIVDLATLEVNAFMMDSAAHPLDLKAALRQDALLMINRAVASGGTIKVLLPREDEPQESLRAPLSGTSEPYRTRVTNALEFYTAKYDVILDPDRVEVIGFF